LCRELQRSIQRCALEIGEAVSVEERDKTETRRRKRRRRKSNSSSDVSASNQTSKATTPQDKAPVLASTTNSTPGPTRIRASDVSPRNQTSLTTKVAHIFNRGFVSSVLNSDFSFQTGNDIMCRPNASVISTQPLTEQRQRQLAKELCPVQTKYLDEYNRKWTGSQSCGMFLRKHRKDGRRRNPMLPPKKCTGMATMLAESVKERWTDSEGNEHFGLQAKMNLDRASGDSNGAPLEGGCQCNPYLEFSAPHPVWASQVVLHISGKPICFQCANSDKFTDIAGQTFVSGPGKRNRSPTEESKWFKKRNPLAAKKDCARFLNIVVYVRTSMTGEWQLVERPRAYFDGGTQKHPNTYLQDDEGQEYRLRLPSIQIQMMRIFLVCSKSKGVRAPQETFFNTGHVFQTSPAPLEEQFRTVKIELLTADTSFDWSVGVNNSVRSELTKASDTSGVHINCTAVNVDEAMAIAFSSWLTPGNGKFRQSPSEFEPPKLFDVGGHKWEVFTSKKRNLRTHPDYFVEKRMVCFQKTNNGAGQQCCVAKSLSFKDKLTQQQRQKFTAEVQTAEGRTAKSAIAELRNF